MSLPVSPGIGRGTEGFFRLGQDAARRWWLIDPAGRPFYCRAVHDVRAPGEPDDAALPPDSVARLRRWGFNTLGAGAYPAGQDEGLAFFGVVDFLAAGPAIAAHGVRLPDVFDAAWRDRAGLRARAVCAPQAENRDLLGWVTDDRLAWAPAKPGGPGLLQVCLSLEPGFRAYHAAWEFVLALHGGRSEVLGRAWGVPLPNKEVVRELTRTEQGIATRGYQRDEVRWTREYARRYFTTTAEAIRATDPHHLVLGSRLPNGASPAVWAECAYPAVDLPLVDWRALPAERREVRAPGADAGGFEPAGPVLASEVEWVSDEYQRLPLAARVLRLSAVEWMLRRGRAALERMGRNPAVVGYAWSRWQDEAGEQPPFARGLVHTNGAEAREHTEVLTQFNGRVESLRGLRVLNESQS
jgi:hypothetical protein